MTTAGGVDVHLATIEPTRAQVRLRPTMPMGISMKATLRTASGMVPACTRAQPRKGTCFLGGAVEMSKLQAWPFALGEMSKCDLERKCLVS